MRRKRKIYPDDFKLKVVQEYLNTDISYASIQEKYGLNGNSYLSNWMRKFDLKKPTQQQLKLQQAMSKEKGKTQRERELEEKLHKLEQELEHERLRTLALDTLIDVAERDLKISIRKKPGAKQ